MKKDNPYFHSLTCSKNRCLPQLNKASMSLIVVITFLFSSYPHLGFSSENTNDEKTKCIAQLSLMERMAITHWNVYTLNPGEPLPPAVLVENGYIKGLPDCPSGGSYSYTNKVPSGKKGSKPYAGCDHKGHIYSPYQPNSPQATQPTIRPENTTNDEKKCLEQLSLLERLTTAHSNMNAMESGAKLPTAILLKEGYIKKLPACPAGGIYSYTNKVPSGKKGSKPYASCDHNRHTYSPYQPNNLKR